MQVEVKHVFQDMQSQWDDFVLAHPQASAYHLFSWGQAVESAYGFTCHRFASFREGTLSGVLPVVEMRSLTGKKQLCALPYCDIGGPLALDLESKDALLNSLINHANTNKIDQVELRSTHKEILSLDEAPANAKVRMLLPLPPSSAELMASFKSKLRSQIRKAEKNGLRFRIVSSETLKDDLPQFYKVISENMRDLGSPVHSISWYEAVLHHFRKNAFIALVEADIDESPNASPAVIGAALVLLCNKHAVIPWASTLASFNRLAPNMLLYWAVLSTSIERGAQHFDFGRSTVGEGTFNFKKQWGALPQQLDWKILSDGEFKNQVFSEPSSARNVVEKVWKKLPLGVANKIGPPLRKRISL
uniref:GNAT family N-acetyltransferase n=1 Tax=Ningiella ruwaisensis TaxID=2364274 RepID=UPI0010A00A58|nr:GNAT family N-acetyltransferase [Ningiella ruwaisensis]